MGTDEDLGQQSTFPEGNVVRSLVVLMGDGLLGQSDASLLAIEAFTQKVRQEYLPLCTQRPENRYFDFLDVGKEKVYTQARERIASRQTIG